MAINGSATTSVLFRVVDRHCMEITVRTRDSDKLPGNSMCLLYGDDGNLISLQWRPYYRDVLAAASSDIYVTNTTRVCDAIGFGFSPQTLRLRCQTDVESTVQERWLSVAPITGLGSRHDGVVVVWDPVQAPRIGELTATAGDLGYYCLNVPWSADASLARLDRFCLSAVDRRLPQYPRDQRESAETGIMVHVYQDIRAEGDTSQGTARGDNSELYGADNGRPLPGEYPTLHQRVRRLQRLFRDIREV